MKKINKIKTLSVLLATTLGVFGIATLKTTHAEGEKLNAGKEINISNLTGNLSNINIRFEFSTSVNLDGTNNALLVGLASSDNTILTDERFIVSSTNVGVYDSDNVAVSFENAPEIIGTKTSNDSLYTYSFESRDFTVVNNTKDIAKLVIVGQKGEEITSEISFSEVKYSVTFGSEDAILYSYNALIEDPVGTPEYSFDKDGHYLVTGWTGSDSSMFESGVSKATKDITYSIVLGELEAHTWTDVDEIAATETTTGVKAHQVCSDCGAIRLSASEPDIVSEKDLVIPQIDHVHDYQASFDWSSATNPGDKPVVVYSCKTSWCEESHTVDAADINVVVKEGSLVPSTCQQTGSVTYVASCTYDGVNASEEYDYVLPISAHSLTHHDPVAPTLDSTGNIEYWTCDECNEYFLDAAGSQSTTAEAVLLPKYSLEQPQYISVHDLKYDSVQSYFLKDESHNYDYSLNGAPENKSVVFQAKVDYTKAENSQIYIYGDESENWNSAGYIWFQPDKVYFGINDEAGSFSNNQQFNYGYTLQEGNEYEIEYGRLAIMNGDEFTGKYHVYFAIDGNVVGSVDQAICQSVANGGRLHLTGDGNFTYVDINYSEPVYEQPDRLSLYDINYEGGSPTGGKVNLNQHNYFEYTAEAEMKSVVYNFVYECKDPSTVDCQIHFSNTWTGDTHGGIAWLRHDNTFISKAGGGYAEAGKVPFPEVGTYEVEVGKLYVDSGLGEGNYYIYIKVDGELLVEYLQDDMPDKANLFLTGTNGDVIYDVNYVEPTYETPDIISVNDLYNDKWQNGSIDLLESHTYRYDGFAEYGSVVFKGTFNFASESYDNGDNNGTQFRFYDNDWTNGGMVWFNGGAGVLIAKDSGYVVGENIPKDVDVNVEIGCLAILDQDGEFTGSHYIYVKADGTLLCEYISSAIDEDHYSQHMISFTGKAGNGSNVIKNIEIPKTVTLKVGSYETDVEVLRSGYLSLPEFGTEIVPADKRIVGWKVEGTDSAFDIANTRIYNDLALVATLDDFKWKVTFGQEELFVLNGGVIEAPATIPTQDYDDQYHYVFDCWVDANGNPFVSGSIASADITYSAKFNQVAHEYGEWTIVNDATCTANGLKTRECSCGHSESEEILAGHKLSHVDAVNATCTANGNVEYYICSECNKYYADENATTEITDIVVPAHGLTHHDGTEADCTHNGNIEYWECEVCHKYYSDANGTNEVESVIIPKHHDLVKVDAVAPSCEEDGNVEYYHCNECGKNFSDAEGKSMVTNVVVSATGHKYGEDGKCSDCGALDPNYQPPTPPSKKGCKGLASGSLLGLFALAVLGLAKKRR